MWTITVFTPRIISTNEDRKDHIPCICGGMFEQLGESLHSTVKYLSIVAIL